MLSADLGCAGISSADDGIPSPAGPARSVLGLAVGGNGIAVPVACSPRNATRPGWHNGGDEQFKFPPLSGDRYPASGHALPDLPPHGRVPARQPQRGAHRALSPGPPRSTRSAAPVVSPGPLTSAGKRLPQALRSDDVRSHGCISVLVASS